MTGLIGWGTATVATERLTRQADPAEPGTQAPLDLTWTRHHLTVTYLAAGGNRKAGRHKRRPLPAGRQATQGNGKSKGNGKR